MEPTCQGQLSYGEETVRFWPWTDLASNSHFLCWKLLWANCSTSGNSSVKQVCEFLHRGVGAGVGAGVHYTSVVVDKTRGGPDTPSVKGSLPGVGSVAGREPATPGSFRSALTARSLWPEVTPFPGEACMR